MNIKKIGVLIGLLVVIGSNALYSQVSEIDYEEWDIKNWDINCDFKPRPGQFVIDDESEFVEMTDCVLMNFDLNSFTIIGVQGLSPGHFVPNVDIRILQDDNDKKIIVEVTLSGGKLCEVCKVMKPFYRRAICTDKLDADYKIEFSYIKIDG